VLDILDMDMSSRSLNHTKTALFQVEDEWSKNLLYSKN
jgi:hypothetical protein